MVEVRAVTDKQLWEDFIATCPEANFLQSWYWGEFHQQIGKKVYYSGFYESNQLAGVMLSVVENARRGRYLTVPGGPIINWQNSELVKASVSEMKRLGKLEKCAFVRVRPQIVESSDNAASLKKLGFRRAQMHLHAELTSQLNITADEQTLLNQFRKNTRYELKKAKKRGIVISHTTEAEAIDEFYELQLEPSLRHGFVPYGKNYLKEQFRIFAAANKALLYSAHTSEGKLIAQAYVIFYNQEAAYHYGASTELGRSEPGAYLIQWEAIKEAKRRNMTRYNFWGVVEPEQTQHRFYGVSVFKRGFRGHDIEYLHARDLVLNKAKYLPNYFVETVRKRKRRL